MTQLSAIEGRGEDEGAGSVVVHARRFNARPSVGLPT